MKIILPFSNADLKNKKNYSILFQISYIKYKYFIFELMLKTLLIIWFFVLELIW